MTREELSKLYEECGYLVHRRCRALLTNDSDAEDAMQEVFARVQKYDRGEAKENVLGWLYSITNNVCFDVSKRRNAQRPADTDELQRLDLRQQEAGGSADRRAVIGAILRSLDSKTRHIGVLHHLDGYTQEEVAQKMGYSRKTVGKKLARFEAAFAEVWLKMQTLGGS